MRMRLGLFLIPVILLSGCSYVPRIPGVTPFRIEIQQGNYISQEAVSQLKLGMTKEQVRFVLGTPLVADIFHENRWDYVYRRQRQPSMERDALRREGESRAARPRRAHCRACSHARGCRNHGAQARR